MASKLLLSAFPAAACGRYRTTSVMAMVLSTAPLALAQSRVDTLPAVVVHETSAPAIIDITGFSDTPVQRSPLSATAISASDVQEAGAGRLSDLYLLDASVSDAYNASGYYDYASVRGYVLDNSHNFRREGLPISAETSLPLEHLERVEILKGTSGIQAGTSAPGGLFNLVVKRPTRQTLRSVRVQATDAGNFSTQVDLGGPVGRTGSLGYRLNLAAERLNTHTPGTGGQRGLVALALSAKLSSDSLLEGEFEWSRRSQASVPGMSLLGDQLPPADAGININHQPWTQPVVFQNFSGSLRYTRAVSSDWSWQAQIGTQRLVTDDRLAYPFGCFDATAGVYYADRYCPNGDFDLYDFRSERERRQTTAASWKANGTWNTGALQHQLMAGVLVSRFTDRGQPQADNNAAVGTGNLFTLPNFAPLADFTDPYTQRTERSTEWFATDVIRWNEHLQTWLGLRHTRLERESVRTDGSRTTRYAQSFTTPWLAATWQLNPQQVVYASWGQGVESEVAPGRDRYTNQGQALPALKSRQWELGIKGANATTRWNATYFDIVRPISGDLLVGGAPACGAPASCTRVIDGDARHRGLEFGAGSTLGAWKLDSSATWIDAKRMGSAISTSGNGQRPTNVPTWVLRAHVGYALSSVPGLQLGAHLSHEGRRNILPDGSLQLPGWSRVDASIRYDTRINNRSSSWTLAIENLFDRRYFKESPYQYAHVYLFPATQRTVRLAWQTDF